MYNTYYAGRLQLFIIIVGLSRGMLHRRNIAENRHFLLSRWVRMFEYCVVKNVENIKVLETINVCLSETLRDGEKLISYLNSGKQSYQNHVFLFLIQIKVYFFIVRCYFNIIQIHELKLKHKKKTVGDGGRNSKYIFENRTKKCIKYNYWYSWYKNHVDLCYCHLWLSVLLYCD